MRDNCIIFPWVSVSKLLFQFLVFYGGGREGRFGFTMRITRETLSVAVIKVFYNQFIVIKKTTKKKKLAVITVTEGRRGWVFGA